MPVSRRREGTAAPENNVMSTSQPRALFRAAVVAVLMPALYVAVGVTGCVSPASGQPSGGEPVSSDVGTTPGEVQNRGSHAKHPGSRDPMVSGFDHVAAPMRNSAAMVRFYRALGFRVNEGERICSVHFGDQKINFHRPALWQSDGFTLRAPSARPPCGDFCFVWDGSADALTAQLDRAGAKVIEGPVAREGGRAGGTATGTSWYVRDPDGNLLEFIVYPTGEAQ